MRTAVTIVGVCLLFLSYWIFSRTTEPQKSLDPLVAEALSLLKNNHVNAQRVDWAALESSLLKQPPPSSRTERHDSIRFAIESLSEPHTMLLSAEDVAAMMKPNDVSAYNRYAVQSIRVEKFDQVAYLAVPEYTVVDQQAGNEFATSLQARISAMERENPKGWIVDLRGNTGGNMWPVLAGLSCFFDDSTLGEFRQSTKVFGRWWVDGNTALLDMFDPLSNASKAVSSTPIEKSKAAHACAKLTRTAPVVLLVDGQTASSGEAIAISFLSRGVRAVVGEKTAGLATANVPATLSDGSILAITVGSMSDRLGTAFPSGITPNKLSKTRIWKTSSLEGDDAIRQAAEILLQ